MKRCITILLIVLGKLIAHVRYIKILIWVQALETKLQMFHDSIVSQFPEETWAQRKPNQI